MNGFLDRSQRRPRTDSYSPFRDAIR